VTVQLNSVSPLSESINLSRQSSELMLAKQQFYGRQLMDIVMSSSVIVVQFEEVNATHIELELEVRCAGFDFVIQIVDVGIFIDVTATLNPNVPHDLQRAGFMYLAKPFFDAVEKIFKSPVSLISVKGLGNSRPNNQALGMRIRSHEKNTGKNKSSKGFLYFTSKQAWRELPRKASKYLTISPSKFDAITDFTIEYKPVFISLEEFRHIELGDVLVLDVFAKDRLHEHVELRYGPDYLQGIRVKRDRARIQIISIDPSFKMFGGLDQTQFRDYPMTSDLKTIPTANDNNSNDVNGLKVAIEFELNRLSLPVSALQTLAVGQAFNMLKPIDDESVVLKCGGRVIGAGQLVAIGDHLGVRITSLELGGRKAGEVIADKVLSDHNIKQLEVSLDDQA
jgi:flagellar motor switch/type III secretory pathway protein FliN